MTDEELKVIFAEGNNISTKAALRAVFDAGRNYVAPAKVSAVAAEDTVVPEHVAFDQMTNADLREYLIEHGFEFPSGSVKEELERLCRLAARREKAKHG